MKVFIICSVLFLHAIYPTFSLSNDATLRERVSPYFISKEYEKIYQIVVPEAEKGDLYAETVLGTLLLKGEGVSKDEDQVLYWFRKAAEGGFPTAQYSYGSLMFQRALKSGDSVDKAIEWIEKAANQKFIGAEYLLMIIYSGIYGVKNDNNRYLYWKDRFAFDSNNDEETKKMLNVLKNKAYEEKNRESKPQ